MAIVIGAPANAGAVLGDILLALTRQ